MDQRISSGPLAFSTAIHRPGTSHRVTRSHQNIAVRIAEWRDQTVLGLPVFAGMIWAQ